MTRATDQFDVLKTFGDMPARNSDPPSAAPTASASSPPICASTIPEPIEAQRLSESNQSNHSADLSSSRYLFEPKFANGGMSISQRASVTRQIESVALSPNQIDLYFNIYYTYYHTGLPMLPPSVSPDVVYKASPVLFWTIVVTAARHDCTDFSLLPALMPAVKRLLWTTIASPPHTLPSLQAMILLCLWTFPVSTMPEDITYILAGLLKSGAIHVGLHRPEILELYSRNRAPLGKAELFQAVRAWCCIYLAVEGASLGNGHLPVLPHDRTIQKVASEANPYELPEPLYIGILTQRFLNKVHMAFGSLEDSYKVSMLSLFEPDLQELEVKMAAYQSHRSSIYYSAVNFQLKAYAIFDDEDSDTRRLAVLRAFTAALGYIDALRRGDEADVPMRYLPFPLLRMCFTAAVFISKVLHSSYGQFVNQDLAKAAFATCISVHKQCSVEDNDMDGRVTTVLPQLWGIHKDIFEASPTLPPRLSLRSRSFLSIAHDGLWQWRAVYAGKPSNGAPSIPPPLISPVSMGLLSPTTAVDPSERSLSTNSVSLSHASHIVLPTEPVNISGQRQNSNRNDDDQQQQYLQEPTPSGFTVSDNAAHESWTSTCDANDTLTSMGLVDQYAMPLDLLFSSHAMEPGSSRDANFAELLMIGQEMTTS
ncbi:hypothetical protein N5P37_011777 [Trichoderma harzianum]|uniref:Transcription factor domain-containing protein n=1 Tax=Trichoderma harzianum CBS 226.95 TaxID=983964 RepID=A0A2T3ZRJ0_TRIHA|nr:hypothetical protein M431DRAFT_514381 [Trichoderma harzianum CBS 226.95]KAK0755665.1 hypothetical protein N5P37_011777 [Trichoderma harzianum]PTB47430.1 hypothetical protein M431DRAFT_514381 [Trichoderma harzianum CBS 226.95]